jgi:hypothetical protein
MADSTKSGWGKFFQTIGAGAGILALQHSVEEALTGAGKKAGEAVGKKIGSAFGLSSEDADKTTDDESLFEKAIVDGTLTATERATVKDYLRWLRKNNPKLAKEWVLWVHNTLVKFERKIKKISGTKDNKEERVSIDYTDGILVVEGLFHDIVTATDEADRELALLERNICVKEKKPAPAVEATKKFAKKTAQKVVETGKKVGQNQQANFTDLSSFASVANTNAKKRLHDAINNRR